MYILILKKIVLFVKKIYNLFSSNFIELYFVKHSNDTITQYKYLHKNNKIYGSSSLQYFDNVKTLANELNCQSIIDFGCGKGVLSNEIEKKLKIKCTKYDPAIEQYDTIPNEKFDLLICTDVLEHVPLENLDNVLSSIKTLSNNCFFAISCRLAGQILPNGENAHCTVYPKEWWKQFLYKYFSQVDEIEFWDKSAVVYIAKN